MLLDYQLWVNEEPASIQLSLPVAVTDRHQWNGVFNDRDTHRNVTVNNLTSFPTSDIPALLLFKEKQ